MMRKSTQQYQDKRNAREFHSDRGLDFLNNRTIYVKAVPARAGDNDIVQCFKKHGNIEKVYVSATVHPRWGNKFAFVCFDSEETAKNLLTPGRKFNVRGKYVSVAKRHLGVDKSRVVRRKVNESREILKQTTQSERPQYEQSLETIHERDEYFAAEDDNININNNSVALSVADRKPFNVFAAMGADMEADDGADDGAVDGAVDGAAKVSAKVPNISAMSMDSSTFHMGSATKSEAAKSGGYLGKRKFSPSSSVNSFKNSGSAYSSYSFNSDYSQGKYSSPESYADHNNCSSQYKGSREQQDYTNNGYPNNGYPNNEYHDQQASSDVPKDVDTISYSLGELRIGQKRQIEDINHCHEYVHTPVARIDGIPEEWNALDLFHHLNAVGVPLIATLLYNDIDERKVRQGLIQLCNLQETIRIVNEQEIRTPLFRFVVLPSRISDIDVVRDTYEGRFTAFNIFRDTNNDDSSQGGNTLPYLSATAYLPFIPVQQQFPIVEEPASLVNSPTLTHADDSISDKSERSSGPGQGSGSSNHKYENDGGVGTPLSDVSHYEATSEYDSKLGEMGSVMMAANPMIYPQGNCNPNGQATNMFVPMQPVMKPSQTVIINNLDNRLVREAANIAMFLSQYGRVLCADVLPISVCHSRAYVTFDNPLSAVHAATYLSVCCSGPYRVQARLA